MKSIKPYNSLRVVNHARSPARLRFRCNGVLAWETWLPPGGGVQVPDPLRASITARASILDEALGTDFFAVCALRNRTTHLLAKMGLCGNAPLFSLEEELHGRCGELSVGNLTRFELQLSLRLLNTPFEIVQMVPAEATRIVRLDSFDFGATVNGVSSRVEPIRPWQGEFLITCTHGPATQQQEPQLVVTRRNDL